MIEARIKCVNALCRRWTTYRCRRFLPYRASPVAGTVWPDGIALRVLGVASQAFDGDLTRLDALTGTPDGHTVARIPHAAVLQPAVDGGDGDVAEHRHALYTATQDVDGLANHRLVHTADFADLTATCQVALAYPLDKCELMK
jgi:hypothetical protein